MCMADCGNYGLVVERAAHNDRGLLKQILNLTHQNWAILSRGLETDPQPDSSELCNGGNNYLCQILKSML